MRFMWVVVIGCAWPLIAAAQEPESAHSLHQREFAAHRFDETSPTLLAPAASPVPLQAAVTPPCRTIFGYLPYWESSANIHWDLLTHLACFSVEVNSQGTITNFHGWPWTSTINTAHQNGVKVILVVTLFDTSAILTLMNNATYKNNFFVNMKNQILAGNADGLNVDFEGTGTWRSTFHTFLGELTTYLHTQIPGCEVTFAGPALTSGLNTTAVASACDGIFIMGYAFAGSWSTTSAPNAPLIGGSINITNTVEVQWGAVTQSTPQKLILGLPYYGHHWTTQTSAPRSTKISFIGSTRFRDDAGNSQLPGRELLWDSVSQTPWYRWNDGANWHQVWFDDAASLGLKYDLVTEHNLKGVGMWALNYDGTRPELWDELDRRYGSGCPPKVPDFDGDSDVDIADFGKFQACLTGPDLPQSLPQCWKARIDADSDADLDDYTIFERCLSGPGHPASSACLTP